MKQKPCVSLRGKVNYLNSEGSKAFSRLGSSPAMLWRGGVEVKPLAALSWLRVV